MKRIFLLVSLFLLLMSSAALAKPQTYTATGEYIMSSSETLEDGIKHAREDALRLISESVGVYVESQSEAKNQELTQDEIKTMSANIIRVVSEAGPVIVQHGKGLDIKMTVTAEADADQLFTQKSKEIAELKKKEAKNEIRSINDTEEKYIALFQHGDMDTAKLFLRTDFQEDGVGPAKKATLLQAKATCDLYDGEYQKVIDDANQAADCFAADTSGYVLSPYYHVRAYMFIAAIYLFYLDNPGLAESYMKKAEIAAKSHGLDIKTDNLWFQDPYEYLTKCIKERMAGKKLKIDSSRMTWSSAYMNGKFFPETEALIK